MTSPPPDPSPEFANRLVSWKEIAAYFRVTVRTVQNWEAERGLPVHRIPGGRGRVYADPAELVAWQAQIGTLPPKVEPEVEEAEPARTRIWPLVALVLIVLIGWAVWRLRPVKPEAVAIRLEGPTLIALDRSGGEVWRYTFHEEPVPNEEVSSLTPKGLAVDLATFSDIDGDGKNELLFPLRGRASGGKSDELFAFSPNGDFLWRFRPSEQVRSKAEHYSRDYCLKRFQVLAAGKMRGVLAAFSNDPSDPSVLVLLSPKGKVERSYWHSGHINVMHQFDMNSDGIPEIILGAVANHYGASDVIVLDPRRFSGASREDDEHQILDHGPPVELARLLLPRTRLSRAILKYDVINEIRDQGGQLTITAMQIPIEMGPSTVTYFRFDASLRLSNVHVADITPAVYLEWRNRGSIDFLWDKSELEELKKIRYLTPLRW